jgi:hypothetical protein
MSSKQFLAFQEGLLSVHLEERTETARKMACREIAAGRSITYQICTFSIKLSTRCGSDRI